jgi:predicted methyltransferase
MRCQLIFTALTLLASVTLQAADVPTNIVSAVAATERSDKDRERDVRDRPAELMTFAGIAPGMKIADVFGGQGYWTELLARAVGPTGQVRLVNNAAYSRNILAIGQRFGFVSDRLPNTEHQTVETGDLKLGRNTFDVIMIFMSYHDLYWVDEKAGWPAINAGGFLDQLQAALKPSGHLLIVDHAAVAGTKHVSAQVLHRIDEAFAKQDIESHGFKLEKTWDGYRNPSDDLTKFVYDPAERGKTDRFTHLYRKN